MPRKKLSNETKRHKVSSAVDFPYRSELKRNQRQLLAAFAETGNITRASQLSRVNRTQHYHWLKEDPLYQEAFKVVEDIAADRLEEEARRRAIEGLKRFKFHLGKPVIDPETGAPYYELEYSDTLLIFLLKSVRPEKYRENRHVEMKGTLKTEILTEGQINERLRILAERIRGREALPGGTNGTGSTLTAGPVHTS